jgi:hypothetical protein
VIRFVADTARASKNIETFLMKVQKAKALGGGSDALQQAGIRGLSGRVGYGVLGGISGGLSGIAAAATAATIAVAGLGYALNKTFHFGNLVEQARITLETITGSVAKASVMMREAIKYSVLTQFKPGEVLSATSMMARYGVDPFKKGGYGLGKDKMAIEIIAGMASMPGMGGHPIGLDRAVNALAGRDIRVIKAFGPGGITAYEEAKKMGVSGSTAFISKLLEGLGKIPYIMEIAKRQSESVAGLWSTISGFAEETWIAISGAQEEKGVLTFWSQIREILFEMRTSGLAMMERIRPFLVELGAFFGSTFKAIFEVLKSVFIILSPGLRILKELFRILFQIGIFFNQTFVKALQFTFRILDKLFGGAFGKLVSGLIEKLSEFVTGLQIMVQFWGVYIDYVFNKLEQRIDRLIAYMKRLKPLFDLLGNIANLVVNPAGVAGKILERELNQHAPGLMAKDRELTNKARADIQKAWDNSKWGPESNKNGRTDWESNQGKSYFKDNTSMILKEMEKMNKFFESGNVLVIPKEKHKNIIKNAAGKSGGW